MGARGFRGWGGGLTDAAIIGVATSSRGYLPGPITAGTWTLVIGEAKLPAGTGHYSVDVTFRDAPTLTPVPRAPFAARVLATGPAWYKGDFHVHDEESGDAAATFAQIIDLARSRGLDFVELTDHNTVSQQGRQAAARQQVDDVFLLRGAEVTTYAGHGNPWDRRATSTTASAWAGSAPRPSSTPRPPTARRSSSTIRPWRSGTCASAAPGSSPTRRGRR